jgi:antitoxin component of RelBE/YafQ-DinJ toxin-antitoxin module
MQVVRLRIKDDLKAKAQQLASQQGVSLNSYINATLAATVAQAETIAMMGDRLSNVDREKLHARVMKFMSKTQTGPEPSPDEIERAIG